MRCAYSVIDHSYLKLVNNSLMVLSPDYSIYLVIFFFDRRSCFVRFHDPLLKADVFFLVMLVKTFSSKKNQIFNIHTRSITLMRVTSGGVHLRSFAPGQHSSDSGGEP